jgi:hypothetical protein
MHTRHHRHFPHLMSYLTCDPHLLHCAQQQLCHHQKYEHRKLCRHQKLEKCKLKHHQKCERHNLKCHQKHERCMLKRLMCCCMQKPPCPPPPPCCPPPMCCPQHFPHAARHGHHQHREAFGSSQYIPSSSTYQGQYQTRTIESS